MYNVHRGQKEDNNECISFRDARSTAGDFLDLKIGLEPLASTVFLTYLEEQGLNDCKLINIDQRGHHSDSFKI